MRENVCLILLPNKIMTTTHELPCHKSLCCVEDGVFNNKKSGTKKLTIICKIDFTN